MVYERNRPKKVNRHRLKSREQKGKTTQLAGLFEEMLDLFETFYLPLIILLLGIVFFTSFIWNLIVIVMEASS